MSMCWKTRLSGKSCRPSRAGRPTRNCLSGELVGGADIVEEMGKNGTLQPLLEQAVSQQAGA